jgi:hypothetical protein
MEPESSLPCSQEPSSDLYPTPVQSSPYNPIPFLLERVYIGLTRDLFPSGIPIKILYSVFSAMRAICPVHLILLDLIILIIQVMKLLTVYFMSEFPNI